MIDKIYDINGVAHKVQAAGTVYNEQKNSLALGTGTTANGQDQLVFGRHNIADTGKAEIVGGGYQSTGYPYSIGEVIKTVDNSTEAGIFIWGGTTLEELLQAIKMHFTVSNSFAVTISSSITKTANYYIIIKAIQTTGGSSAGVYCFVEGITNTTTGEILESNMQFYRDSSNTNPSTLTQKFTISASSYELNRISTFVNWVRTNLWDYTKISQGPVIVPANIRTLDLNGNETLAGKLTAAGNLETSGSLKIGSTTLSEAQLTALLALIEESESAS